MRGSRALAILSTMEVERAVGHRIARCWSCVLLATTGRLFTRMADDSWREHAGLR